MTFATLSMGFGLGLLAAVPAAWWWSRRASLRGLLLERRALAAERLAELGTMTSGLAHEIKNPLSTIGLNVQLVQEDLAELQPRLADHPPAADQLTRTRRRIDGLHRETDRLRHILEDFLRFAGRVELDPQPTDLNQLCDELIDFFQPQADEAAVRLRGDLPASPVVVAADGPLLKQAVLNLLINACQAMADARDKGEAHGGADELILRIVRCRKPEKRGARACVEIHITDTGPGIPGDAVSKVFQPYFSTKRGGTGLGLPTTRRIVEEHGGELQIHSAPGRGSDFVIRLPAE
jgi:signal transduction histidine kinase